MSSRGVLFVKVLGGNEAEITDPQTMMCVGRVGDCDLRSLFHRHRGDRFGDKVIGHKKFERWATGPDDILPDGANPALFAEETI